MKFQVKDLIEKGLVKSKTYSEGPYSGLSVLKYSKSVFWDNRWNEDSRLLDCRGIVVDQDDNVIIWPFTKIFNRFENETDLPLDKEVVCVRKVNGFMASATFYKGKLLVSTTGSLDSDFSDLAYSYLKDLHFDVFAYPSDYTFIFEICDISDPHIVAENNGAYLIGARDMFHNEMVKESVLDRFADYLCCRRPGWSYVPFGDVIYNAKEVQHEGYVVRDPENNELLLKIKSPYYLTKKFFMRGGINKFNKVWDNTEEVKKSIEEEYYPLLDFIKNTYTKEQWLNYTEQDRRVLIEEFLHE